ncbi:MAG: hypothetical protein ACKO5J_09050 [Rubrivivax sp.]
MHAAWIAFVKELVDALRDRRTMLMVLLSSVALGPLTLVLMSVLVSDIEKRAEARQVVVVGLEHAPTLANYLQRQTQRVEAAPADYARQLQDSKLGDAVLLVPADFEERLARGEPPVLEEHHFPSFLIITIIIIRINSCRTSDKIRSRLQCKQGPDITNGIRSLIGRSMSR